jgi:hypothetical protein
VVERSDGTNSPDPSALTIARIDHEISALKELLAVKDGITAARLGAMDRAVALLEKFPTAIDVAVDNLKQLHQEKFEGVGVRFIELNTRLTQGDIYKQTALDAALKAAQTLVDKQQENNKESIKKTEELFSKQLDGLKETVDGLKSSVNTSSGAGAGVQTAWVVLVGAIVVATSIVSMVMEFLRHG